MTATVSLLLGWMMAAGAPSQPQGIFVASSKAHRDALWTTDGTANGTALLRDFKPNSGASFAGEMVQFGRWLYFRATDGAAGPELWRTDGTRTGTRRVHIVGDASRSVLSDLTVFRGALYFEAPGRAGPELWMLDGDGRKPAAVDQAAHGEYSVCGIAAVEGGLVYGREGTDEEHPKKGHSFCRVEETSRGERKCFPFDPPAKLLAQGCKLFPFGRFAFFRPFDGSLWRTDGTVTSTALVKAPGQQLYEAFTVFKERLYFQVLGERAALWKTDGTAAGTVLVKQLTESGSNEEPAQPIVYKGAMYFSGYDLDQDSSALLWKSDGTEAGTVLLKNLHPEAHGFRLKSLFVHRDTLFLVAGPVQLVWGGDELWKSDGTAAGTVLVRRLDEIKAR